MGKEKEQTGPDEFQERFKSSSRFQALIDNTRAFLAGKPPISPEEFYASFTGRLFEELAFLKYLESIGETATLLNPNATLDYFSRLYGDLPTSQTNLQESIMGKYVPDGLLFPRGAVDGPVRKIFEYTAQRNSRELAEYIQKKEERAGMLRRIYPDVFGISKLQIIFTSDVHSSLGHQQVDRTRTSLRSVPYTYREVHDFARDLRIANFPQAL